MLVLVSACGGGGGGGTEPDTPPPTSTNLVLTVDNTLSVSAMSFLYSELMLQFGQLAVDWVGSMEAHGQSSQRIECGSTGTLALGWRDTNASGRIDAGDTLDVVANHCHLDLVHDTLNGSLAVQIDLRTTTELAGALHFGADVSLGEEAQSPTKLSGQLPFTWAGDDLGHTLDVGQVAHSFALGASINGSNVKESLGMLHAKRSVRRDAALITLELQGSIDSELIGGEFDVATTQPLRGRLRETPYEGAVTLSGGGDLHAVLLARSDLEVELRDSLESVVATGGLAYSDFSQGFLWWPTGVLPVPPRAYDILPTQYRMQTVAQPDFSAVRPLPGTLAWQFNAPVTTEGLRAILYEDNSLARGIDCTVRQDGAWLRVEVSEQLAPGGAYRFRWSHEISGSELVSVTLPEVSFTVLDTVSAAIAPPSFAALIGPDSLLVLDGSGSRTIDNTTRYFWHQLSGPELSFSSANSAITEIRVARNGSGDSALVELQVSNAAGETVSQQVTIQTVPDPSIALYQIERSPVSAPPVLDIDPQAIGQPHYYSDTGILDVLIHTNRGVDRFLIDFADTPQAGARYSFGTNGDLPGMLYTAYPRTCSLVNGNYTGQLDMMAFSRDLAGNLLTLAFDVRATCAGVEQIVSVRYRSELPPAAALP
jgi:hypothetical protein